VANATLIGDSGDSGGEPITARVRLISGVIPSDDLKLELAWHARVGSGREVSLKDVEFVYGQPGTSPTEPEGQRGMVILDDDLDDDGDFDMSSHRISTTEVTRALLDHPSVEDAAVLTVPDEKLGERMKAFIRLREGVEPSNDTKLDLAWHVMTLLKPVAVFRNIDFESPPSDAQEEETPLRESEAISISGKTVLADDVERALTGHRAVSEAVVIGVPDMKHGKSLQAFVTLRKGEKATGGLKEELAWHARTEIGPSVVFKFIEFRKYFPKAADKKELRRLLRADALDIPTRMSINVVD
jgi:acyl-coenzyme A synthetase/AMP-(fatty) acid ligase